MGDIVPSVKGAKGQKHFVSPKKSQEIPNPHVILKPSGITEQEFKDKGFSWKVFSRSNPSSPTTVNDYKCKISRDNVDQFQVGLMIKGNDKPIDIMNVWIVWSDLTIAPVPEPTVKFTSEKTTIGGDTTVRAAIKPNYIFEKVTRDVPDMNGQPRTPVPGSEALHAFDNKEIGNPKFAWDISRRWRERDLVPTLSGADLNWPPAGAMSKSIPNANIIQKTCRTPGSDHYPEDALEGNDDSNIDEDPYTSSGVITEDDPPNNSINTTAGSVGDKAETRSHFEQFVRVQIGKKWYIISDSKKWKFHMKAKKVDEATDGIDHNGDKDMEDKIWIDDGSSTQEGNDNF